MNEILVLAAQRLKKAKRAVAFTGAGISVESGIPPFRGKGGLWSKYNPDILDIRNFYEQPEKSWQVIKEIFYDHFNNAQPNAAHIALAKMESDGLLQAVITQNIDNLHQDAGSKTVLEYHGSTHRLVCLSCHSVYQFSTEMFDHIPPRCKKCGTILKPDMVFFGEGIPFAVHQKAMEETVNSDVWLVIGTTGEVMPACNLPIEAKDNGATIIEINIRPSHFTQRITDLLLQGKATEMTAALYETLSSPQVDSS
jgi:NAD-dependent deacetylase